MSEIIYYCEQGNPYCQSPNCRCNTVKPNIMEKNKELTPMMELKQDIFLTMEKNGSISYEYLKNKINELLPKEKQVIESCCIDMVNLSITKMENLDYEKGMEQEFNDYYNTKYNNQIK